MSWRTRSDDCWLELELPSFSTVNRIEIYWWGKCVPDQWNLSSQVDPRHTRLEHTGLDNLAAKRTGKDLFPIDTVTIPKEQRFDSAKLRLSMFNGHLDPWFKRHPGPAVSCWCFCFIFLRSAMSGTFRHVMQGTVKLFSSFRCSELETLAPRVAGPEVQDRDSAAQSLRDAETSAQTVCFAARSQSSLPQVGDS